jgi:starch synthase
MEPTRILFISQEIFPFVPETPISIMCREIPQFVQERGYETRIFMPCFGNINERRNQLHEVQRLSGMNLIIDDSDHPLIIKVASIQSARLQIYFIDNEEFYRRKQMDRDHNGIGFDDNDERSIFYIRGVLETIKKLRWTPNIIHCNGWITGIAPLFIKKAYNSDPFFKNSKIVYSLFNDAFPNNFNDKFHKKLMLDGVMPSVVKSIKENPSWENVTKLAIDFADAIVAGEQKITAEKLNKYIQKCKIPFIPYSDDYKNCYYELYEKLLEK